MRGKGDRPRLSLLETPPATRGARPLDYSLRNKSVRPTFNTLGSISRSAQIGHATKVTGQKIILRCLPSPADKG